jgi:hypothetical protein
MDKIKAGIFESKAKFIDVAPHPFALDIHYIRYMRGERYPLAKQCYQHVEKLASENVDWAIKIKAGPF